MLPGVLIYRTISNCCMEKVTTYTTTNTIRNIMQQLFQWCCICPSCHRTKTLDLNLWIKAEAFWYMIQRIGGTGLSNWHENPKSVGRNTTVHVHPYQAYLPHNGDLQADFFYNDSVRRSCYDRPGDHKSSNYLCCENESMDRCQWSENVNEIVYHYKNLGNRN